MRYYVNGVKVTRTKMLRIVTDNFMNFVDTPEERLSRWEVVARTEGVYELSDLTNWQKTDDIISWTFRIRIEK